MTHTPLALEVRGLGKRFGGADGRWVLKDLSFSVADGEFITLVGPSGSGKSTLLNLIAQVDAPNTGQVLFRGQVIADAGRRQINPGWNRTIGYVMQDDNLLPWRTLRANVEYPLKLQGRLDAAANRRIDDLIAAVNLTEFQQHLPHQLSGGMRKRASLIRTLAYDPPIILMDEPFGALDAQTRGRLQADLMKLWEQGRKTIVFVTHDIGEAILLGDRTLALTRAPACVGSEHRIDIERPRDVDTYMADRQFGSLYSRIRAEV